MVVPPEVYFSRKQEETEDGDKIRNRVCYDDDVRSFPVFPVS